MDLFDAIHSMRTMRRLKPDPIPDSPVYTQPEQLQ